MIRGFAGFGLGVGVVRYALMLYLSCCEGRAEIWVLGAWGLGFDEGFLWDW